MKQIRCFHTSLFFLQTSEDLRLLISSAVDAAPPLKLLLVGQHVLRSTLKRSQHADLLNRINVHYQLRALSREGTGRYLDVQMQRAGGGEDVFDAEVKGLIHDFTGGVRRRFLPGRRGARMVGSSR